jgi:magnesium transporter
MMALEFDFEARTERALPAAEARPERGAAKYVWFDLDAAADPDGAGAVLRVLGLDGPDVASALDVGPDRGASYRSLPSGLQLAVAVPDARPGPLGTSSVALVLGEGFCATVRRGPVGFLADIWRGCPDDFRRFAQSPGFLLFEFWDHLVAAYRKATDDVSDRVQRAQDKAFASGDEIFGTVAALSRDLLTLRRALVGAREVLGELVTRRSAVVPASTQPFLQPLVGSLDRLVADLAVDREILAEALNLYIGLVGHRTNRVVNRLTVISFVFLPLSFLCGVYGMNFKNIPELQWPYGYALFWAFAVLTVSASLSWMKWRGWW